MSQMLNEIMYGLIKMIGSLKNTKTSREMAKGAERQQKS